MGSAAVSLPRKPPSSLWMLDSDHSQTLMVHSFVYLELWMPGTFQCHPGERTHPNFLTGFAADYKVGLSFSLAAPSPFPNLICDDGKARPSILA